MAGQDGSQTPQWGHTQKAPALPKTPQAAGLHPEHHPGLLTLAPTGCLGHCATHAMPWHRWCGRLGAGDAHAGCECPSPARCSPPCNRLAGTAEPRGGTSQAHGPDSCLAAAQGPAGRGCWQGPSTTGDAPTQLSLSVMLPMTVPLGSASPLAPRYGADPGMLGPQGTHGGGADGEGGGH